MYSKCVACNMYLHLNFFCMWDIRASVFEYLFSLLQRGMDIMFEQDVKGLFGCIFKLVFNM